jgi:hypothetical protein
MRPLSPIRSIHDPACSTRLSAIATDTLLLRPRDWTELASFRRDRGRPPSDEVRRSPVSAPLCQTSAVRRSHIHELSAMPNFR